MTAEAIIARLGVEMWTRSEKTQLLQQLYDVLSSNSRLPSQGREERILALLAQINDRGEPEAIYAVAQCLFEPPTQIKTIASRTIQRLLSLVSPDQLIDLSDAIRWSWGWNFSEAWGKLKPQDMDALLVDSKSRAAVLGLLSFHRSGYVRQEAVRRLDCEAGGDELPYLLIRQNDWVSVISQQAQAAVNKRLVPEKVSHFIQCLPLVVQLLRFQRQNLSAVVRKVVEMLLLPEHDAMLAEAISHSNRSVRRQVVRVALDMPNAHQARVIHNGLTSQDAVVRLHCAKRVGDCFLGPELHEMAARLRQDRFMPVRREGFVIEANSSPDATAGIWQRALLDRHASLRELARFWLGKTASFDAASFYRRAVSEDASSLPAASGLAECGDEKDLAAIQRLCVHPQVRFRLAGVRGMARIARERAVDELLQALLDASPKVVREAKRQMEPFLSDVPGAALLAIVNEAQAEHVKTCVMQLIADKGKWQSLPWLIKAACVADDEVAATAWRLAEAWFSPPLCNRVFTKPTLDERMAIELAMEGLRAPRDAAFLVKLREWLQAV